MSEEEKKENKITIFNKPVGNFEFESIGKVVAYPLTMGRMIELGKKLKKKIKDCTPDEFIENLLQFLLFKISKDEKKNLVNEQDVAQMSQQKKEKVIKVLIESDIGLYRKNITEKTENDKGEIVIQFKHGEVEHPQEDGESLFHYYHRLNAIQEKEFEEQAKKMTDRLKSSLNFSSGLNNRIADMFKNMNPIANQMSHLQKMAEISQPFADLHKSISTASRFSEIAKNIGVNDAVKNLPKFDHKFEREEFKPIVLKDNKLEALNELKESSDLMTTKMDDFIEITALMLNELKDSGDLAKESSRHSQESSKLNVKLTVAVIVITVILGALSIGATFIASNSSTDAMLPPLKNIAKSIESQDSSNGDNGKQIIDLLKKNLESNQEILKELKKSNQRKEKKKLKK